MGAIVAFGQISACGTAWADEASAGGIGVELRFRGRVEAKLCKDWGGGMALSCLFAVIRVRCRDVQSGGVRLIDC